MAATSVLLIASGISCLLLWAFAMYSVVPRDGKPHTAWTSTEARSTMLALSLLVLVVFGIGLIVKGLFN